MTKPHYEFQIIGADGTDITKVGPNGKDGGKGDDGLSGESKGKLNPKCISPATNGSPGDNGKTPRSGAQGGHGYDSPTFKLICKTISGTLSIVTKGGKGGQGGDGGSGGTGGTGGDGGTQPKACLKQYGDTTGGAGGPGGNGGDAGAGGNGGNCGDVTVFYDESISNPIQNINTRAVGKGGNPGNGGKKGVGGQGGMSGNGKTQHSPGDDGIKGGPPSALSNDGNPGNQNIHSVKNPPNQLVINVTLTTTT